MNIQSGTVSAVPLFRANRLLSAPVCGMIIMKKSVVTKKMVLKDAKNAPALVELQKAVKDNVIEQFIAKRKERGMTQSDVSTVTGIQRPNISRLESGYYNPTLDMLVRLADSIDCNVKITFVDK